MILFVYTGDSTENGRELAVFEENYALLFSLITDVIDPLMKWLVDGEIFTVEEEKESIAVNEAPERLRLLLSEISDSLKANDTKCFYAMLKIMKEHGGKGTQTLADHIMNRLKISVDKLSQIWCDNNHIQNNETNG